MHRLNREHFLESIRLRLQQEYRQTLKGAAAWQLHNALAETIMDIIAEDWRKSEEARVRTRRACYFSAEFLVGRAVYNNLCCLGLLDEVRELLESQGVTFECLEEIEDAALGNGGLGRLAACFLDSAATLNLPLDGYGIRYRFGLFRQAIENGYQREYADHWTRYGDPWSVRRDEETVQVVYADQTVNAVPYDMPIIGYGTRNIGTLRLWQAEPQEEFNFALFNAQKYDEATREKNRAEDISRVLYPNDDTEEGKILRLKQEYFFSSASLQSMIRSYKKTHGTDFSYFADCYAVQLNDTHPAVSVPELCRLLMDEEGMAFSEAFAIAQNVFSYTNHTIMSEALEKWNAGLMRRILPRIYEIIEMIQEHLSRTLAENGIPPAQRRQYSIIDGDVVHMARLVIHVGHTINGVAKIHTEILKKSALPEWYALYPERFRNETNGVTQRRWLLLCNPKLSELITRCLGTNAWITDLTQLRGLERFADNEDVLREFIAVKQENKRRLANVIAQREGVHLDERFLFDIQVKRLHEYKRQLLNVLAILDLYFGIKEGSIRDFTPTAYIFGAKSAPGYARAKAIIHFICEIADRINHDPDTADRMKVVFVQNYNVSYAEKMVCAADLSEQISTAGTEASGTSNMKFMMNGTVTLGTYDGANVEIVREAGEENNYIFGARVEEIERLHGVYNPITIYKANPRIRRVLDTLIDGTFSDGGTGAFRELYDSLLKGAGWHAPDHYFLLHDFESYVQARQKAGQDYRDSLSFARKGWMNLSAAGIFSSDRTIRQYAEEIWHISPIEIE